MFLTPLKTAITLAMRDTFDEEYPSAEFRGLHVSVEYPISEVEYPGVWVGFDIVGDVENAGVGHIERSEPDEDGHRRSVKRWRFQGITTYTVYALSSHERDRLFDEIMKIVAFGNESNARRRFRYAIEHNDLIAVNFDFDQTSARGFAASPGTPWGTDDVIYEATIGMETLGEFVSEGVGPSLVPLSDVVFYPYTERDGDPSLDPEHPAHPPSDWF